MHQSSLEKMRLFRDRYLDIHQADPLSILDVGSQDINGSYRTLFDCAPWRYRGADLNAGDNVDIVLTNPYQWKEIASDSVDVLISGQAFEHIEYFWITMLEVARVLRPGGLCCIIAPSGGPEHRYPLDCWRFYPDGGAAMTRFAGLELVEVCTDWEPGSGYTDESSAWKDTMVVSRKPRMLWLTGWREAMRRRVLHRVLCSLLKR